jgi:hypothetical protein
MWSARGRKCGRAALALLAVTAAAGTPWSDAWAGDPFDGRWTASAPALARCPAANFDITVSDGQISGTLTMGGRITVLTGSVLGDGTATIASSSVIAETTFGADTIQLKFTMTPCGNRVAAGDRIVNGRRARDRM